MFDITVKESNMKIVNYLNVTINVDNGTYQSYKKPNNKMK